jgi:hypothetical protein
MRQQGLADAWYVFDQEVTARQNTRQRYPDLVILAEQDRADLGHSLFSQRSRIRDFSSAPHKTRSFSHLRSNHNRRDPKPGNSF